MTKDEALKLALEALVLNNAEWKHLADSGDSGDWSAEDQDHYKQTEEAITAIKEALAQTEQEPLAWSYWQSCLNDDGTQTAPWVHRLSKFHPSESIINKDITPLYTTPLQRKPLTDEEIILIVAECAASHQHTDIHFARAIERAHGIKELV